MMYTELMILIAHILIALSSLAMAAVVYIAPSQTKLRINYGLIIGTLTSGTYLVISSHSGLVSACTTGLIYLAAVSLGTVLARQKLSQKNIT